MTSHAEPPAGQAKAETDGLNAETVSSTSSRRTTRRWWIGEVLALVLDRTTFVPFVASWEVSSAYVLRQDFRCKNYPGLLHCHLVSVANDQSVLITYWRSDGHFRTQRAAFVSANNLDSSASWIGELADIRIRRQTLWPTSAVDALLKIAALLGAMTVCFQAYVSLWAAPTVVVTVDSRQPVDALANSVVPLRLVFTNLNASSAAQVELKTIGTSSGDVRVDTSQPFFTLSPGGRYDLTMNAQTARAGDVRLRVDSTAKAGRLRRQQAQTTLVDIRIWGTLPRLGVFGAQECHQRQCLARAQLSVGRPEPTGFRCWAYLAGYPQVEIRAVRRATDGGGQPAASGEGDTYITKIDWRQPPSEAFQRQAVDIVLVAQEPRSDWQELAGKIKGLCEAVSVAGG